MKKQFIILITILFLIIIFDNRDLKCQKSSTIPKLQYHSEYVQRSTTDSNNEDGTINDKNLGVRLLELVIKRNINQRYQKLYPEELEDMLKEQMTERR